MAMVSINWNPTDKALKQFAWISLVGFPLIGWVFSGRPTSFESVSPWTATLVGLGIGVFAVIAGMIYPKAVKPIFLGLSLITLPIGFVVGEVFLLTVFFGVFTIVSIIFRLIGFDPMTRKYDPSAESYWEPKAQPTSPRQYLRQY